MDDDHGDEYNSGDVADKTFPIIQWSLTQHPRQTVTCGRLVPFHRYMDLFAWNLENW